MLARWNYRLPAFFGEMEKWNREMNQLFGSSRTTARAGVFPPVNVYDRGDALVVKTEVPGLDPSAIEVNATMKSLTIKGERKHEESEEKRSYHRRERSQGFFSRSLTLPQEVDPDKVTAGYTDGVLEVVLPKAEESKPRKITINA